MNSFKINFEAARRQGFSDGVHSERVPKEITAEARERLFGTTYVRGYNLGRVEAQSRKQGPCNQGTGVNNDCPPTVGEEDELFKYSMIDGLALRLQEDIIHAMTVTCREDAAAKAVERAAELFGYERVFDINLHPRARAHIDDFVREKTDEYEREFKRSQKWNTHKCEAVENDIRLLEGRVQNRDTANYVKRKIAEAKRAAESSVKQTKEKIVSEALTALQKIEEFAASWLRKTGGTKQWKHEGHKRALAWEKASDRAENLSILRSTMFPVLDNENTSEMEAWTEALFAGRAYAEVMDVFPKALRGFSVGGLKIWIWWMAEQMKEYENERARVQARFLEEQEADLYKTEMLERRRKRAEEMRLAREEKARLELERQAQIDEKRRRAAEEQRKREAEVAQKAREEKEKRAEELAEQARLDEAVAEIALQEAQEAREAEEALREQQNFERDQATRIQDTLRQQRQANAARAELLRREVEERDTAIKMSELSTGNLKDNLLSDFADSEGDDDIDDKDIDDQIKQDDRLQAEEEQQRAEADEAAADGIDEMNEADIVEAQKEVELQRELQSPENVAKRREAFFNSDASNRLQQLKKYAAEYDRIQSEGASRQEEKTIEENMQGAASALFAFDFFNDGVDVYEKVNGISPAERLFYAVTLQDIFFDRNPDKAFEKRRKAVRVILDEDRLIKAGYSEGVQIAIENDDLFNAPYVAAVKAQAEVLNIPLLNRMITEWQRLVRKPSQKTASGRSQRKQKRSVAAVVDAYEDQYDDETDVEDNNSVLVEDTFMNTDGINTVRWLAQTERKLGDKLIILPTNQSGTRSVYETVRGKEGKFELKLLSLSEDDTDSDTDVDTVDDANDESAVPLRQLRQESAGIVAIPVGQPLKLAHAEPVHAHNRLRRAFIKVVMKKASTLLSRVALTTSSRIMPAPATIARAIPEALASVEPVLVDLHGKGEHLSSPDKQIKTVSIAPVNEAPEVIENWVR